MRPSPRMSTDPTLGSSPASESPCQFEYHLTIPRLSHPPSLRACGHRSQCRLRKWTGQGLAQHLFCSLCEMDTTSREAKDSILINAPIRRALVGYEASGSHRWGNLLPVAPLGFVALPATAIRSSQDGQLPWPVLRGLFLHLLAVGNPLRLAIGHSAGREGVQTGRTLVFLKHGSICASVANQCLQFAFHL